MKRYLLDRYDADVFLHTWDVQDHATQTWHRSEAPCVVPVDDSVLKKLYALYAPKDILIESQTFFHDEGVYGTSPEKVCSLKGIRYMLYAQKRVNDLRIAYEKKMFPDGKGYDLVVMIRPDILLRGPLILEHYMKELIFDAFTSIHLVLNVHTRLCADSFRTFPGGMDVCYFAYPHVMTRIVECYDGFDRYYREFASILPEGIAHPEVSFCESLLRRGVVPRFYQFDYVIKRLLDADDISLETFSSSRSSKGKWPFWRRLLKLT